MDRVKTKRTTINFLGICAIFFFAFMMAGTTILISYTTHKAAQDDTRRILAKEARHIDRHLYVVDGELQMDPGPDPETEDCYYAVIVGENEIFAENFPQKQESLLRIPINKKPRLYQAETEEGDYYLFDRRVKGLDADDPGFHGKKSEAYPEEVHVRTIIAAKDVDNIYKNIQHLYYLFLSLLICILGIGGCWFYRRADRPVRKMCDKVQQIIEAPESAGHIDDEGPFYETEVMTRAYNRLVDQSRQMAMQQGAFNENVSHELRTPVAVIRSECEMVEDLYKEQLPPEVADSIATIHRQSDRMNAMIAELLYLARIDRGDSALNLEWMDLEDLAESAGEDAEDLVEGARRFIYDLQSASAAIDVTLVMIAVRNLISNAVRYSPEDSEIRISTGTGDGMAYIRIQDEGIGIAEENQTKIFKPYYQVREERNSEGFGLGLALAHKIAEIHGGSIELESELNVGSTFTMFFPAEGGKQ